MILEQPKILYVEDSPHLAKSLRVYFSGIATDFDVSVLDRRRALGCLQANGFEMVFVGRMADDIYAKSIESYAARNEIPLVHLGLNYDRGGENDLSGRIRVCWEEQKARKRYS